MGDATTYMWQTIYRKITSLVEFEVRFSIGITCHDKTLFFIFKSSEYILDIKNIILVVNLTLVEKFLVLENNLYIILF